MTLTKDDFVMPKFREAGKGANFPFFLFQKI